ncbi:MAG: enoyl-CoA hydratase-related protein [Acidimicrobiaceae bacterium]|nr:enoyl-CoA hydratase-related protein [Acidimicrobiaceae bacterium]
MTADGVPNPEVVLLEVDDGVGVITLNRPQRRNALHRDMHGPIQAGLRRWAADDAVGCIVITGAGKGFCAGGDVRDGGRRRGEGPPPGVEEAARALLADAQTAQLLHESPKLTLAAVNGAAVGAGLALALACDFRIMASSAALIPGWARLAFSGDFGGSWFLARLVGASKALDILTADAAVDAPTALSLGLANRVAADDDFARAWQSWARELASGPRQAHAFMKENVRDALRRPLAEALPLESRRMIQCARTADHREAVRAWLDKRPPDFSRAGRADAGS